MKNYTTIGEENERIHKEYLAKKYGILNNPKLDELYKLAWSFGHSYGYKEIEIYFSEMAELIK